MAKRARRFNRGAVGKPCDGCGLCCLHKLEDEDTGEYHYTSLACELLHTQDCTCGDYDNRSERVEGCLKLTKQNYHEALPWLPDTCAYKEWRKAWSFLTGTR